MLHRPARRAGLLIAALVAVLVLAPSAMAGTATISVTTAAGKSDPVAGVGRTFTVRGNAGPETTRVWVLARNVGGAACTPSPDTDQGRSFDGLPYGTTISGGGDFTITRAATWSTPGPVQFCIWFSQSDEDNSQPLSQQITFRAPTASLAAAVTPGNPAAGQEATVTFTGASEASSQLYATTRPAGGAPCAPTYDADPGSSIAYGRDVDGAFTETTTTSQETDGLYVVCAWLADSSNDATPAAGPRTLTYRVGAPPPQPAQPTTPTSTPSDDPSACAVRSGSVRRGRSLRLRCYRTKGRVRVRFRRRGRIVKTRTVRVKRGRARVSTRGLRGGTYKVSILNPSGKIGSRQVRIRR